MASEASKAIITLDKRIISGRVPTTVITLSLDFIYVENKFYSIFLLNIFKISVRIGWVIIFIDPKIGVQHLISDIFNIMCIPNRHIYISRFSTIKIKI